jgi:poly(A) polymerase
MTRLAPQAWMTANSARRVMSALEAERPGCARFVGGCVRNALLDEPVADVDIATQLTPDVVERVMRAAGIAVHPTGIEHGTLTVVADHHPYEVTTLRRDVETDGRRAVVAFTEDWAEDAMRRDFRINALYAAPDGEVFDPTGGGLADAASRRIVFAGDADTRIREDYLRILRFFRFNAWYGRGEPDADGLEACGRLREGLDRISAERIWSEIRKLLGARDPLPALRAMEAQGVLRQVLPEAIGLSLVERLCAVETATGAPPDAMLRFLSLFPKDDDVVAGVARALKMSNAERDRLVYAARDETPIAPGMSEADRRRVLYRIGQQVFRDRAHLLWADSVDGSDAAWSELLTFAEKWQRPVMPVAGDDLLAAGVAAGPALGVALRRLEAEWIDSDFTLSRGALLARVST